MKSDIVSISFNLNGDDVTIEAPVDRPFVRILRDDLRLTGTKVGCGEGECGTCTILVDDEPVCSCILLPCHVHGKRVETIEGLCAPNEPLTRLQQSFVDAGAVQCGFCTPGMIMAAEALVRRVPHPSRDEIKEALAGNLCRCTGYEMIFRAVEHASGGDER